MRNPAEDFRDELERLSTYEDQIEGSFKKTQEVTDELIELYSTQGIQKKIILPVLNFEHFDIS